jgi:hypothetical protein
MFKILSCDQQLKTHKCINITRMLQTRKSVLARVEHCANKVREQNKANLLAKPVGPGFSQGLYETATMGTGRSDVCNNGVPAGPTRLLPTRRLLRPCIEYIEQQVRPRG